MAEPLGADAVRRALEEDRARDDVTTQLLGPLAARTATGTFVVEEACVVAGLPVAAQVFSQLDPSTSFDALVTDGARVPPDTTLATVRGSARTLLAGERTALNFLQRLSGIATATRMAVDAIAGTGATVTDTRKTTPGLRELEKYAVRMGGGQNHRATLADAVLWKDNHWRILADGALAGALQSAPAGVPLTVEVETEVQFAAALAAGVTRILVDNAPAERVASWVHRAGPGVAIEASGGIQPETALAYARAGARFISIGALTHSVRAVGIRFDLG